MKGYSRKLIRCFFLLLTILARGLQGQTGIQLNDAIFGKPYKVQLRLQMTGTYPFTFSVVGGALPHCLQLSPEGLLSGMPVDACHGSYQFKIAVTDSGGEEIIQQKYWVRVSDGFTSLSEIPTLASNAKVLRGEPENKEEIDRGVREKAGTPAVAPHSGTDAQPASDRSSAMPMDATQGELLQQDPQVQENRPHLAASGELPHNGEQAVLKPAEDKGRSGATEPQASEPNCIEKGVASSIAAPVLRGKIEDGDNVKITGSVQAKEGDKNAAVKVRVCVDHLQKGEGQADVESGKFSITVDRLQKGSVVTTQALRGDPPKYGQFSVEQAVSTCSGVGKGSVDESPIFRSIPAPGGQLVLGSVPVRNGRPVVKMVRVCVDERLFPSAPYDDRQVSVVNVDDNGAFEAPLPKPIKAGQVLVAQGITDPGSSPLSYGLAVKSLPVEHMFSTSFISAVGGVEQSGYSSDLTNSNGFFSAYLRSDFKWRLPTAFWGRVRFLSAPQQTAPNIVSMVTNPSGAITQSSLGGIGAVLDYVIGPEIRIHQWDGPKGASRINFVMGIGETTPLSTANPKIFNAPEPNTDDCKNLIAQNPSLVSGADLSPSVCLKNPADNTAYKYVAFTEQKRTGFLFKWGAGVRLHQTFLPPQENQLPYDAIFDMTLGQDQTITGGKTRGIIFRLDGQYPLNFANLSSFYLFGSSSIRLHESEDLPTITLAVPQSGVPTLPDKLTVVLSTEQPNRDFYRFGVGLNLVDLIQKMFPKEGSKPSGSTEDSGTLAQSSNGKAEVSKPEKGKGKQK